MKLIRSSICSLLFLTILGLGLRLFLLHQTDFPLNDFGLHQVIAHELMANHFRIPQFTSYNHSQIPFCYPPLSTYLLSLVSTLIDQDILVLLRWLPLLLSLMCIPLYWLFLVNAEVDRRVAFVATFLYLFSFVILAQLVKGGGVSRSAGHFFCLSFLIGLCSIFNQTQVNYRRILFTGLAGGALVLSHPEQTLFAFFASVAVLLTQIKKFPTCWRALVLSAAISVFCVLPWLSTIWAFHGLAPLMAASSSAEPNAASPWQLLAMGVFFSLPGQKLLYFGAIIGLVLELSRKRFLFPVLWVLVFFFQTRGQPMALSLLASYFSSVALVHGLDWAVRTRWPKLSTNQIRKVHHAFLSLIATSVIVHFIYDTRNIGKTTLVSLDSATVKAFDFIRQHTDNDASFYVISSREWYDDFLAETFPAFTDRRSLTTCQGLEWRKGEFVQCLKQTRELKKFDVGNSKFLPPKISAPLYLLIEKKLGIDDFCALSKSGLDRLPQTNLGPVVMIENAAESVCLPNFNNLTHQS